MFRLVPSTICGAGLLPDQTGMLLSSYGGKVFPVGTAKWKTGQWEVGKGIQPVTGTGLKSIAVAPTGTAFALGTQSGSVALIDMQTGMAVWTISLGEIPINSLAWSGDGRRLAACSGNFQRPFDPGVVYLLDPKTGAVTKKLAGHQGQVNQIAFSPDGNSLSSSSSDRRVLTYDLHDLEKPPHQLKRSSGTVALVYLSDGLCAVSTFGGGVEVCDLQQGRSKMLFVGHEPPAAPSGMPKPDLPIVRAMSVAPDSKHLVTTDFNGMVYVWPLTASAELHQSADYNQDDETHWNADFAADILKIGTFAEADEQGRPVGWDNLSAFETGQGQLQAGGRGIVILRCAESGGKTSIATSVNLPPKTEHVTFMVRLRGSSIQRGQQNNAGGGVRFSLVDSAGHEREMPRVDPPYAGYRDWTIEIHTARVLEGETKVRIGIEMINATGDLEVDEILVVPSNADHEATFEQTNVLDRALENDDPEAIATLIKDDARMLEMRVGRCDNGTPLIRAAWKGSPRVAAKLIELGADVEAQDRNWGNTPLWWCSWWGTHEVAAVLLAAGAEPRGASQMAQYAKTANRGATRSKEDFDAVSKLVDEYEAIRRED